MREPSDSVLWLIGRRTPSANGLELWPRPVRDRDRMTTETKQPAWRKILSAYQKPDLTHSIFEIFLTITPLALLWAGAFWASVSGMIWLAVLLCLPASVFLVRMFLIQHDCGHHAFFKSPTINNWVGRCVGILTLTPYDVWRRTHAIHHAASGNLDRRGLGAIDTLTVEEYQELSSLQKLGYRAYRHPITLFIIGPVYMFFLEHRIPSGIMKEGWRPWVSAIGTNVAVAMIAWLLVSNFGWAPLLAVFVPSVFFAAVLGVWLFYVQHQFEDVLWFRNNKWNHTEGALLGSSHYDLPQPLSWLTGYIGIHHVHHAASKIPFYKLPKVLKDHPDLKDLNRLTLWQSFKCVPLALWDEKNERMISFRQFRKQFA